MNAIVELSKKLECLDKIINYKDNQGDFAKDINNLLKQSKDYIRADFGPLDFAIISNIEAVGVTYLRVESLIDPNVSYWDFVKEYTDKCKIAHHRKDEYVHALSEFNKQITLACIIDIPYADVSSYSITDTKKRVNRRASNHLPISETMLQVIQMMNTYEFVILCTHCIDDDNYKRTDVKYFIPRSLGINLDQQNLRFCTKFERIK